VVRYLKGRWRLRHRRSLLAPRPCHQGPPVPRSFKCS
jgi:hypothetical protein